MLRKLTFTALILVAVLLSLAFPGPFTRWGSFELKVLIIPILMVIMFGMGTLLAKYWQSGNPAPADRTKE